MGLLRTFTASQAKPGLAEGPGAVVRGVFGSLPSPIELSGSARNASPTPTASGQKTPASTGNQ